MITASQPWFSLYCSYLQALAGLGDHSDLGEKCLRCGEHCSGPLLRSRGGSLAPESAGDWGTLTTRQTESAPGASDSAPTRENWRGRPGCWQWWGSCCWWRGPRSGWPQGCPRRPLWCWWSAWLSWLRPRTQPQPRGKIRPRSASSWESVLPCCPLAEGTHWSCCSHPPSQWSLDCPARLSHGQNSRQTWGVHRHQRTLTTLILSSHSNSPIVPWWQSCLLVVCWSGWSLDGHVFSTRNWPLLTGPGTLRHRTVSIALSLSLPGPQSLSTPETRSAGQSSQP